MSTTICLPDRETLIDLGEWAAVGFYEGLDLPWPRSYGLAFRRMYEHMPVTVQTPRRLLPDAPLYPLRRSMAKNQAWCAGALIVDFDHNAGLRISRDLAEERKRERPDLAEAIDALVADLAPRLPYFGGYTHSNPDMRRLLAEGFDGMEKALDRELVAVEAAAAEGDDAEGLHLLRALKDYTCGVRAFHGRILAAIRAAAVDATGPDRRILETAATAFASAFLRPARTFYEGILAAHLAWFLDGHDSIGRLDQYLGPLYERDLAEGRLDQATADALLDEVWQDFEAFNGWNLQIGGRTADGGDGANALTAACLEACRRNRTRRPNVAFRITADTPPTLVDQALSVLADGSGRPALYNDDAYITALRDLDLGIAEEDLCEIGFGGCTETMLAGISNVGSLDGQINLASCLERALWNGREPLSGKTPGPATGELVACNDFDQVLAAVREQIRHATDTHVAWLQRDLAKRFTASDPKLYRTFFTRDCVARHRSFEAGGARYNWSVVSYQGIANLIDSLAAIRHCVFEQRTVTLADLAAALAADFQGHEEVLRRLRQAPKFGNDVAWVDDLGAEIIGFAWRRLLSHRTPRGGRFVPSCILFTTYGRAGEWIGALPDGRRAGMPLTDSVGPVAGRDVHGPTAMLRSVAHLPLALAAGTPVLNVRLARPLLATSEGRRKARALMLGFFAQGGLQVQVSAIDKAQLIAAQADPEAHRDLIVRIGGYSEYFHKLGPKLQAAVIERTEHGME